MLLLDSPVQGRWRDEGKRERSRELRQRSLDQEIKSNTLSVSDDAGRDTSCLLAQMGRPLASTEVQRRLHLCNPALIFERSIRYPELTGVYIDKTERNPAGGWTKRKVHLFGMESGIMPEFSVLHQTTKLVPNPEVIAGGGKEIARDAVKWKEIPTFSAETRGWRTVLVRLLHLELITRGDVEKYFGWNPSKESQKWQDQAA